MSDIFDKIASDFKSRKADRTVQVNTGYVQGLDMYGPGNYTDIVDDLDDEFYQEFDGFEREASDFREARLPSRKHNPDSVVEKAWEEHKKKHPSMAEYEGAMTSKGIDPGRVEKNRRELGIKKSGPVDISALGRLANEGFYTADEIDAHELEYTSDEHESSVSWDDDYDISKTSGEGYGSYMSIQNLNEMEEALKVVCDMVEDGEELEDWVEDKISHAHALITDLARFFGYGDGRFTHDGYRK